MEDFIAFQVSFLNTCFSDIGGLIVSLVTSIVQSPFFNNGGKPAVGIDMQSVKVPARKLILLPIQGFKIFFSFTKKLLGSRVEIE